jgi:hypothetical protein
VSKIVSHRGTQLVRVVEPHHPLVVAEPHSLPATIMPPGGGGQVVERYHYIQSPAAYAPPPTSVAPIAEQQAAKVSTDMSFAIAITVALIAFALAFLIFKEPLLAQAVSLGVVLVWLLNSLAKFLRGEG